eukprot:CAMPEP_0194687022 /NCGR_PEP_ID=MMETSP0295-20121207/15911_1 /TAXON_ID=39354 /ORGANISM="Heterosigma akashiwo, Strain CCMP2393" /LENGTH=222 /DNA_ID=CAMNT_0039575079 /DNA_START=24 /DNA_END=693 /DNA_ORIENTATION=+
MAVSNITLLITVALLSIIFSSYGFVVPSNSQRVNKFPSVLRMSEEDVVGVGEEIATDYPGLKLSKLKEIEGNIAEFQLDFEVAGKDSQKVYSEIQKQAKKNANFPGFRKGQLPAYALAELKSFTLEQVINDAILNACDYCKLDVVEEGESAKAEILEDMTDLGKKLPSVAVATGGGLLAIIIAGFHDGAIKLEILLLIIIVVEVLGFNSEAASIISEYSSTF